VPRTRENAEKKPSPKRERGDPEPPRTRRTKMHLNLQPITYGEAVAFVKAHHRHHGEPNRRCHVFSVAVNDGESIRGIATCGRPVARHRVDGWTLEVSRCCTDGAKNASSMLYATCWRAARALGYRRLITYTLATESGTSLRAAGYRVIGKTRGDSWSRPCRRRTDKSPTDPKLLWQVP